MGLDAHTHAHPLLLPHFFGAVKYRLPEQKDGPIDLVVWEVP
jgi:hypothetical protein